MEFLLSDARRVLPVLTRVCGTKSSTWPVLQGILISPGYGGMLLQATNLETHVEMALPATGAADIQTVVPGRIFSELIRLLTEGKVTLSLDRVNTLHLTYQDELLRRLEVSLKCMDPGDFPVMIRTGAEWTPVQTIDDEKLSEVARSLTVAVSQEKGSPALQCVRFDGHNAFATDKSMIAFGEVDETKVQMLMPGEALKTAAAVFAGAGEIRISVDAESMDALFETDGRRMRVSLIDFNFPDLSKYRVTEFDGKIGADRDDLHLTLTAAAKVSEFVTLSTQDGKTQIRSDASEEGGFHASLDGEATGDLYQSFMAKRFLAIVNVLPPGPVRLNWKTGEPILYLSGQGAHRYVLAGVRMR